MLSFSRPLPSHYRFDDFEFRPDSCELFRVGEKQKLQRQPARLLSLLLDRHGQVVRRENILAAIWGEGTFIDVDSGINFTVRQLRIALGDSAANPKYVETVPQVGYRFVSVPQALTAESTQLATDRTEDLPTEQPVTTLRGPSPWAHAIESSRRWRTAAWIGAGLAAVISVRTLGGWIDSKLEANRLGSGPRRTAPRQRLVAADHDRKDIPMHRRSIRLSKAAVSSSVSTFPSARPVCSGRSASLSAVHDCRDRAAMRRQWIGLLTSCWFLATGGTGVADEAGGRSEEASRGVSEVVPGDDSKLLWRASSKVRRSTVTRFAGEATEVRVSEAELAALTKRVRDSKGRLPEHRTSWLKYEVELDPAMVKPLSPETSSSPARALKEGAAAQAEGDFVLHVDTVVSTGFGEIPEPTAVAIGDYVFYTANQFYATSTDGGETFDLFDPFAGPFAPPGSDFCCDQTSVYDPGTDTIFFLQQYVPTATTGVQRISVDQGADGSFECAYDLTPQIAGFPANRWLDFPDLAISAGHLFHSSNVFETQQSGPAVGAMVLRYPLADISSCSANFSINAFTDTDFFGLRFTRGAGAAMYFASHISNEAMRLWSWPDGSPEPTFVDRAVTGWMNRTRTCIGPDNREYCAGVDSRVQSGWVADGVVGFMWSPSQGGGFPYPYTRVEMFRASDLELVEENDINSSLFALVYASVAVNDNDDLGGAIVIGGGETPVTGLVWIADDVNGDQLVPLEFEVASVSGFGPSGGRMGDYTMTQPYYPDSSQWVAGTFGFLGDPMFGSTIQFPGYHRFGREEAVEPLVFSDGFESGDLSAWN